MPWLLAVARNLSRNAERKLRREQSFQHDLASLPTSEDEADVEGRLEWEGVRIALGQLRPVDRDMILLVAWDGLSPSHAGSVLGLLPMTARSRRHRARQRLAALLDQEGIAAPRASTDCPECFGSSRSGHRSGCAIAAALTESRLAPMSIAAPASSR